MADVFSRAKRSQVMSLIRGVNTTPERKVRSMVRRLGDRYRPYSSHLPGRPDIVLRELKHVVLVHGCFWHRHAGCRFAYVPKTRRAFWLNKFEENVKRDQRVKRRLKVLGWGITELWECELRDEVKAQ